MIIKQIKIKSFGPLIDKVIEPGAGLNIIEGANESGKSTVAMFIKFIFYGLSSKATGYENISEKAHYVNWDTGVAAGSMTVEARGGTYRIDRMITLSSDLDGRENYRESVRIIDLDTGLEVKAGKSVGEYFFGFPEKVFMQSAFVKSIDKTKVDGSGLKVALENLAASGDEEINTKKALEKIDQARKLLKHKNGLGGKIVTLSDEKRELTEVLAKSQDVSREVVDVEGTLADVSVKIKKREEEALELSALCRAYEAVRTGARVKEIENLEASVKYLEGELSSMDPSVDRKLLAKIDLCEGTVRDTERDIKTLSEKRQELEAKCEGRDLEEPEDGETIIKNARKFKNTYRFWLSAACAFFAFSVIGIAIMIMMGKAFASANPKGFAIFAVCSAVFLLAAVGCVLLYRPNVKKYENYVEKYEADDIYTLENAVILRRERYRYTKKLLDKMAQIDAVLEEAVTKHDREIDNGMAYAAMLGIEADNVFDALSEARAGAEDICVRRDTMSAKLESARGRLSALLEEVGEAERENAAEAEREALASFDSEKVFSMSKDQYLEAVRQKNFAESQLDALRIRESDLERKLAALRAAGASPAETAARISCLEAEISELSFKHKALMLAYSALERAGEKMRGDVMPRVAQRASEIMKSVTEGRYSDISSGESLDLSFLLGGEKRTVDYLSEGTKDAVYVSLRAALVETMYGEELPAMIFDECFARMDAERLSGMFRMMSREDFPQSLVFTCRALEGQSAIGADIIVIKSV